MGEWLRARSPAMARDSVVIATKLGNPVRDDVNARGLSALHVRAACEASLRRLGVDYVDLLQLHNVDASVSVEELWDALDRLTASGKVLYVGTCNHARSDLDRMRQASSAGRADRLGVVSEQSRYNLVDRGVEADVLPYCREHGLAFLAYSPLQAGFLAGTASPGAGRRSGKSVARQREGMADKLAAYEAFCIELGSPPATVAVQWLLSRPALTSVIVGPGSPDQIAELTKCVDTPLDDDVAARLEGIWA